MTKEEFLKSKDFMRLGKCISSGQWKSVMITISRMQKEALEAEFSDFDRNLVNIRQCAMRKDVQGAKNAGMNALWMQGFHADAEHIQYKIQQLPEIFAHLQLLNQT